MATFGIIYSIGLMTILYNPAILYSRKDNIPTKSSSPQLDEFLFSFLLAEDVKYKR
jgi:hypothetical protein